VIYVIVNVELSAGTREEYLELIQPFLNESRQEPGCLEYEALIEHKLPLSVSQLVSHEGTAIDESDVVTLIQMWTDIDAYSRHVDQPHVRQCFALVKDLVRAIDLRILQSADHHSELPAPAAWPR
jgi:quinol monooxygenase YgiN